MEDNLSFILMYIIVFAPIALILTIALLGKTKKYTERLKELGDIEKNEASTKYKYFKDIPDENITAGGFAIILKPSMTGFSSSQFAKVFSATLLNLALKGSIKIEVVKDENGKSQPKISIIKQEIQDLKLSEQQIIMFIKKVSGVKNEILFSELRTYVIKNNAEVKELVTNVYMSSKSELEDEKLFDLDASSDKSRYSTARIGYIITASFFAFLFFTIIIIVPFIIAIINVVLCSKILNRLNILTQEGVEAQAQWIGLKRFMEDFSMLDKNYIPGLEKWGKYLVYAMAIGIDSKVIKQLKVVYPNSEQLIGGTGSYFEMMLNTDFCKVVFGAINLSIESALLEYTYENAPKHDWY
mgnify:FL=1